MDAKNFFIFFYDFSESNACQVHKLHDINRWRNFFIFQLLVNGNSSELFSVKLLRNEIEHIKH